MCTYNLCLSYFFSIEIFHFYSLKNIYIARACFRNEVVFFFCFFFPSTCVDFSFVRWTT